MKEKKPKKGFLDGYKTYDTSQGFGSIKDWREAFERRMNFHNITAAEKESNKSIVQSLLDAKDYFALRNAYRDLMKRYHPDIAGNTVENKIASQLLNDTYFEMKKKFL